MTFERLGLHLPRLPGLPHPHQKDDAQDTDDPLNLKTVAHESDGHGPHADVRTGQPDSDGSDIQYRGQSDSSDVGSVKADTPYTNAPTDHTDLRTSDPLSNLVNQLKTTVSELTGALTGQRTASDSTTTTATTPPPGGTTTPAAPSLPSSVPSGSQVFQDGAFPPSLSVLLQKIFGTTPADQAATAGRSIAESPLAGNAPAIASTQTVVPGLPTDLANLRVTPPNIATAAGATPQALAQGLGAGQVMPSSAQAATLQTASLPAPVSPALAPAVQAPVLSQGAVQLPGAAFDTAATNPLLARNDAALLTGSTQLSNPQVALAQGRVDVVPATLSPQIAGATIIPGNPANQPFPMQGGIRPGLDGMPLGPRDGVMGPIAGHTVEGVRRRGFGLDTRLMSGMPAWLLGRRGLPSDHPLAEDPAVKAAERAFQWLFWILASVCYASLAIAVLALVPNGDYFIPAFAQPATGSIAIGSGLLCGALAYLLLRRLRA